jgi:DNA invertase Pin-like site-specific DNA recombinase
MMNDAEAGKVDQLVVKEISRLSRNMRDLNRTVGQLSDHGVEVHVIDSGLKVNNDNGEGIVDDTIIMQVLGMAAEMEHKMTVQRTMTGIRAAQAQGKHTGRPPYGFTTDSEGYLVPTDDFETALAAIEMVEAGESKRQTCRHTGINHSTLNNILDSREFYRSNEPEPENDVQA